MCYCLCDVILSSNVYLTEKHKQPGCPMLNKVHTVDKVFAQLAPDEAYPIVHGVLSTSI